MITERDIAVLCAAAHYYVLSRVHVQKLCFPDDTTGRVTRRRLQSLVADRYLNRMRVPLITAQGGLPPPVYFPAKRGNDLLAEHLGDDRYYATPARAPDPIHLLHWLAITDTHLALDRAIASQSSVHVDDWLNEWDVANKDESAPEKRFRIYTLLRESPRLVCAPDAAFLLSVRDHRKVFYLEQDRNTSGVRQIAASKTPGYAEMHKRQSHLRHFPTATVPAFNVLMVAPSERRRDALRTALRGKPGCELWRFAAAIDVTSDRLLHEPIFFPCDGDPAPLVKRDMPPPTVPAENQAILASEPT